MLPETDLPPPWRPGRRSPAWLLRRPLTWLIAAEVVVMLALVALAWHLVQARGQAPPRVAVLRPGPIPSAANPSPAAASVALQPSPRPTPHPGLATDLPTWINELAFINQDQAAWQKAEWSLLQAVVRAVRDYIEKVVLPAVTRAAQPRVNSS
jgi:hypothetical protein